MLATFIFNRPSRNYEDLLRVWERSAEKYMPTVPREIVRLKPPKKDYRLSDITRAFIAALDYVLSHEQDCIITDVDLMFRGDMTTLFAQPFDIAVTDREYKCPLSTGVWYFRNTAPAREFIELWKRKTLRLDGLLGHATEAERRMQKKFGGLDQASLASAIKNNKNAHVRIVPCSIYNAEQSCWGDMDAKCKAVHIASELRDRCLGIKRRKYHFEEKVLRPLINEWRGYL